jgi:hypothetical protein
LAGSSASTRLTSAPISTGRHPHERGNRNAPRRRHPPRGPQSRRVGRHPPPPRLHHGGPMKPLYPPEGGPFLYGEGPINRAVPQDLPPGRPSARTDQIGGHPRQGRRETISRPAQEKEGPKLSGSPVLPRAVSVGNQ